MKTLNRIKSSTKRLIEQCGGLQEAREIISAAGAQGTTVASLSNYQRPNMQQSMPVHFVFLLEQQVEAPLITKALAEMHGYELVKKEAHEHGDVNIHGCFASISREHAKAIETYAAAIEDQVITPREAAEITQALDSCSEAISNARDHVSRFLPTLKEIRR